MIRATGKVLKSIFSSAWGRGKTTLLTVVVALTLATVTPALAANGGNFILGKVNVATTFSRLSANVAGPAMQIFNTNTAGNARALDLVVDAGNPPMTVNSTAGKALNLDADKVDGKDLTEFAPANIFAIVNSDGTLRTRDSSHAVSSSRVQAGVYALKFDRDISTSACVEIAQAIDVHASTQTAEGPRTGRPGDELVVHQFDTANNFVDGAISVAVTCK